jgi:hypothetical protein
VALRENGTNQEKPRSPSSTLCVTWGRCDEKQRILCLIGTIPNRDLDLQKSDEVNCGDQAMSQAMNASYCETEKAIYWGLGLGPLVLGWTLIAAGFGAIALGSWTVAPILAAVGFPLITARQAA